MALGDEASGGLSRNSLKIIACVAMLIDHIGEGFIEPWGQWYYLSQFIGYCAAPIFFFFIVEGYHHTGNRNVYTLRLLSFAALSYFPFIIYFYGPVSAGNALQLNIMYTLLIGLLVIRVRHEIRRVWLKIILIALLFILSTAGDWNFYAPLIILAFDVFRGDRKKQLAAYLLIALFFRQGQIVGLLSGYFTTIFDNLLQPRYIDLDFSPVGNIWHYLGLFLPAALLHFYNENKGAAAPGAKWGFYLFYPVHLAILAFIKYVLL
ncbi:MAG: conjugal transfer protein TraX [Clostridiales Family XIII bacterium]|jgi:hypothetical protein|nr:conjugal transfer protein TraX [Clostridiales Family XIII bacterium]